MRSIHGFMKSMSNGLPMNARIGQREKPSWNEVVRLSAKFTGERWKVGRVGLRRFRPHLPHFAKKSQGKCCFQKVMGQVGLARAIKWRRFENLFFLCPRR